MTKEEIAKNAASVWSRCFKCDKIVNETGLKCEKPGGTCLKWYDAYKGALIALEKDEPSLPSNLDEAAEKYADGENPTCPCEECLVKTFKAGAEWMAGQGISYEDEIVWSDDGGVAMLEKPEFKIDLNQFAEDIDKVIVQIRKK